MNPLVVLYHEVEILVYCVGVDLQAFCKYDLNIYTCHGGIKFNIARFIDNE